MVRIDLSGIITNTLFRKPTAGNSILRADSAHPNALKRSIPFAQYLRIRRICRSLEYFNIQAKNLQSRLLLRGYSRSLLKKAYQQALKQDRQELLYKPKGTESPSDFTKCILTFSYQYHTIRDIINKYWFLLTEDPILSSYVAPEPSITYRRSRSLKDKLVNSQFTETVPLQSQASIGTIPCGCFGFCNTLDTRSRIILPGGYKWSSNHMVTCTTMGVIYLFQLTCNAFYVGKTCRPLAIRISEHIAAAKAGFFKTVIGRHIAFAHNYSFGGFKFLPLT